MAVRRARRPPPGATSISPSSTPKPRRRPWKVSLDLEADFERVLGLPVEIVVLNHAPVDLIHRVLRDGVLLLDRDTARRIHFEVKARNEFFDLQPVLARYRAARSSAR